MNYKTRFFTEEIELVLNNHVSLLEIPENKCWNLQKCQETRKFTFFTTGRGGISTYPPSLIPPSL